MSRSKRGSMAALALAAAFARAESGTPGAIYGNVKDAAGHPLAGAMVSVTLDGETTRARTEDDGYYLIGALPPGQYDVKVEKLGFVSQTKNDVDVREGDNAAVVLVLSPMAEPKPAPAIAKAAEPAPESPAPAPEAAAAAADAPVVAPAQRGGSYKAKRRTIAGTILAFDGRTVLVDVGMGREVKVAYDKSTKIKGELAVGKTVRIVAPVDVSSYRLAKSIKVSD